MLSRREEIERTKAEVLRDKPGSEVLSMKEVVAKTKAENKVSKGKRSRKGRKALTIQEAKERENVCEIQREVLGCHPPYFLKFLADP